MVRRGYAPRRGSQTQPAIALAVGGLPQQGHHAAVPAGLCELERRRSVAVGYPGVGAGFEERPHGFGVTGPAVPEDETVPVLPTTAGLTPEASAQCAPEGLRLQRQPVAIGAARTLEADRWSKLENGRAE